MICDWIEPVCIMSMSGRNILHMQTLSCYELMKDSWHPNFGDWYYNYHISFASIQLICQALRDLAVSKSTSPKADPRTFVAAAYGADAPQEELHEIISKYATNVHGVYVWKTSENLEHSPLR